jgi:hypothetical protein
MSSATKEKEKLEAGDLVVHVNSFFGSPYEYGIITRVSPAGETFADLEGYRVWWIRLNRHHMHHLPARLLRKLS